jgi:hypothetical protein
MTYDEFDERFDNDNDMYDQYMEYIMNNCQGDRVIGNGDMLIEAAEDFYLYEEFRDQWIAKYETV